MHMIKKMYGKNVIVSEFGTRCGTLYHFKKLEVWEELEYLCLSDEGYEPVYSLQMSHIEHITEDEEQTILHMDNKDKIILDIML